MSDRISARHPGPSDPDRLFRLRHLGRRPGTVYRLAGGDPVGRGGLCLRAALAAGFARRRDKHAVARELAHLRKSHLEFETALHDTRARLGEIGGQIEQRAGAQEKKIVAELKVLESLMREFAGKISQSSASPAATGDQAPARTRVGLSQYAGRQGRAAGNHPLVAGRKSRRSLSAAHRQPAAAQAALLRSAVAPARQERPGHHAGPVYAGRRPGGPDECGG